MPQATDPKLQRTGQVRPTRGFATVRRIRFCLALLPMGFTWPDRSPDPPVSSYLTVSPLPARSTGEQA